MSVKVHGEEIHSLVWASSQIIKQLKNKKMCLDGIWTTTILSKCMSITSPWILIITLDSHRLNLSLRLCLILLIFHSISLMLRLLDSLSEKSNSIRKQFLGLKKFHYSFWMKKVSFFNLIIYLYSEWIIHFDQYWSCRQGKERNWIRYIFCERINIPRWICGDYPLNDRYEWRSSPQNGDAIRKQFRLNW